VTPEDVCLLLQPPVLGEVIVAALAADEILLASDDAFWVTGQVSYVATGYTKMVE
jgi:hypothetical protein